MVIYMNIILDIIASSSSSKIAKMLTTTISNLLSSLSDSEIEEKDFIELCIKARNSIIESGVIIYNNKEVSIKKPEPENEPEYDVIGPFDKEDYHV